MADFMLCFLVRKVIGIGIYGFKSPYKILVLEKKEQNEFSCYLGDCEYHGDCKKAGFVGSAGRVVFVWMLKNHIH